MKVFLLKKAFEWRGASKGLKGIFVDRELEI